jgi:hypothetical protein
VTIKEQQHKNNYERKSMNLTRKGQKERIGRRGGFDKPLQTTPNCPQAALRKKNKRKYHGRCVQNISPTPSMPPPH